MVVSHDGENPPDVNAITGASAALMISDIPFENPVAGARISRVNGKLIFNPNYEETAKSDLNLIMAGTADGIVMVESGANEVSEDEMMEALDFGHERIKKVIGIQIKLRELLGKEKLVVEPAPVNEDLKASINSKAAEKLDAACQIAGKHERGGAVKQIQSYLWSELNPDDDEKITGEIKDLFHDLEKAIVRNLVLDKQYRVDGRGLADVRPISIMTGYLPRVHGSAVFTRGETQAQIGRAHV